MFKRYCGMNDDNFSVTTCILGSVVGLPLLVVGGCSIETWLETSRDVEVTRAIVDGAVTIVQTLAGAL